MHDREIAGFLKNLRGKHRRAMLLALTEASAKYEASRKEGEIRYKEEIQPIIDAAYDKWLTSVRALTAEFLASIPEEVLKKMGYTGTNALWDAPSSIKNYAYHHYRDDASLRIALYDEAHKLRLFLRDKQDSELPKPTKPTKEDIEARKLIEEFDASKTLCATNPAPATPNPDGSLDAERI